MTGKVLTVAESDSCGAAGIQADIKTILALGGYAMTAVAAVTAQDTHGIAHLHPLEPAFVAQQMRVTLEDIGAEAIKTGILVNSGIIDAVGDVLDDYQGKGIPVVVDPSLVARQGGNPGGYVLMDDAAIATLKRRLFIRATVLTPNLREAELLAGMTIRDMNDMRHAATMLLTLGAETVLLKAGQATGAKAPDIHLGREAPGNKTLYLVATEGEERIFERPMIDTPRTLGAGATLASAIAVSLAQKMDVFTAIEHSLDFMHQAILHAPGFGAGAGPLNHAFAIEHSSIAAPAARKKK